MGRIASAGEEASKRGIYTRVKCFPLYTLLLALNTTHLNFLSLDVEGAELQVSGDVFWWGIVGYVCIFRHYLSSFGLFPH